MALTVIKNWDNKTWLSSTNYINSFNKFLIKNIDINSKSKVLDIGCGRGKILGSLSKKINFKNRPLGIDIINHKDRDKRINFKKINAVDFSFKNNVLSDYFYSSLNGKLQYMDSVNELLLIGLDGRVKKVYKKDTDLSAIFSDIDKMPMRINEIKNNNF